MDSLKLRLLLEPESSATATTGEVRRHSLAMQLLGGSSLSQAYLASFHTVDPDFQVHIAVPDLCAPLFKARESFHRWHPLFCRLRERSTVRVLVRLHQVEDRLVAVVVGFNHLMMK